ncbi:MAG: MBL fold metallo-hydrolase [Dehalococcoidia bacterium]|nr:MBL fold metallo-hydrolase [Dehalococcoidia bacterium]
MSDIQKIDEGLFSIDAHMWHPGLASAYVVAGKQVALVETGLSTSAPYILKGLKDLGFASEDISYIILTHIHLDHAGSAGILMKEMPRAKVITHKRGVPHLVDPTRLLNGARQALGEKVAGMYNLDKFLPVEAERIDTVEDGDSIDLGGRQMKAISTPGHAPHHFCFFESQSRALFTGDLLGTHHSESNVLHPTTPAPDFNLDVTIDNINKLKQMDIKTLLFSHFGASLEVGRLLDLSIKKHTEWGNIVRGAIADKKDLGYMARSLLEHIRGGIPSRSNAVELEEAVIYAQGYLSYFQKYP